MKKYCIAVDCNTNHGIMRMYLYNHGQVWAHGTNFTFDTLSDAKEYASRWSIEAPIKHNGLGKPYIVGPKGGIYPLNQE